MSRQSIGYDCEDLTVEEIYAIKAMHEGKATDRQQQLFLTIVINKFSRPHDIMCVPGSRDDSCILAGRGFVGMKILKYLKTPIGKLPEMKNEKV